ncbi:MAG: hypothetical protein LBS33_06765 [Streptococcaceae bacterium]|jgi:hypothetical protein|nr:hypothetical protein [Streptococcaceae bacterium]
MPKLNFLDNIPKEATYAVAFILLVIFGPGIIQALFGIGKDVGNALAFWFK